MAVKKFEHVGIQVKDIETSKKFARRSACMGRDYDAAKRGEIFILPWTGW
nr:hypothetical protein [Geobacillus sp. E263]